MFKRPVVSLSVLLALEVSILLIGFFASMGFSSFYPVVLCLVFGSLSLFCLIAALILISKVSSLASSASVLTLVSGLLNAGIFIVSFVFFIVCLWQGFSPRLLWFVLLSALAIIAAVLSFLVFRHAVLEFRSRGSQTGSPSVSSINSQKPLSSPAPQPASLRPVSAEAVELIRQYKALLDSGAITPEEYEQKKKEIIL
jgi:hypothetical protein